MGEQFNYIHREQAITFLGDNEREYKFLVKTGEDMRMDERVQQLFRVMNQIFSRYCQYRF